jgi:hypothetical protein
VELVDLDVKKPRASRDVFAVVSSRVCRRVYRGQSEVADRIFASTTERQNTF